MGIIEKMRLDGKKGFVTGAARGIGKCTATAFAEAGADVAIVDLDLEEAKKTAKEIAGQTGRKVIAVGTDCTDPTLRFLFHPLCMHEYSSEFLFSPPASFSKQVPNSLQNYRNIVFLLMPVYSEKHYLMKDAPFLSLLPTPASA